MNLAKLGQAIFGEHADDVVRQRQLRPRRQYPHHRPVEHQNCGLTIECALGAAHKVANDLLAIDAIGVHLVVLAQRQQRLV